MREIKQHIIHCSDSTFGNAELIREWHLARGWRDIGYHFVILPNGTLEQGRAISEIGAHCQGVNAFSIGTCLIGKQSFTSEQFITLRTLHALLKEVFPSIEVFGHRDFNHHKTCPNFDVRDVLGG